MTKEQLLAEGECVDEEMLAYLTAEMFDSQCQVEVPWGGKMNAVDLLFFLRDHDILHIGWNLAVMDHLTVGCTIGTLRQAVPTQWSLMNCFKQVGR